MLFIKSDFNTIFTFAKTKNLITMKKFLMLALMLCFSWITSPLLKSQTPPDDPEHIPIVIEKKEEYNPSTGPKSPSAVSFNAYYDSATSEIVVSAQNAGTTVNVCVENLVSGEEFLQVIPGNGVSYIPVSGTSGFWQITLYLGDGSVYFGDFTI